MHIFTNFSCIFASFQDDGTNNTLGMQLLDYMKDPGTGWKSQADELKASFIDCYQTPFELPQGTDMPPLVFNVFHVLWLCFNFFFE